MFVRNFLLQSVHISLPSLLGLNLKIVVVDLASREVRPPVQMRAEQGWTVLELKKTIAEVNITYNMTITCSGLSVP